MDGNDVLPLEDSIAGTLPTLIYIPNFVSVDDESQLLRHVSPGSRTRNLLLPSSLSIGSLSFVQIYEAPCFQMEISQEQTAAKLG